MISFALGNVLYGLFDDGVANILGLHTLRHGTNPKSNLSIRLFGGDPSYGGSSIGARYGTPYDGGNVEGHFYVFRDDPSPELDSLSPEEELPLANRVILYVIKKYCENPHLTKRDMPKIYAFRSTGNYFHEFEREGTVFSRLPRSMQIACLIAGMIFGTCLPTLRFRFAEIDEKRWTNDSSQRGAYRTTQRVEAWRLGILGSFSAGLNIGWVSRARANPTKIVTGVLQLAIAMAIAKACKDVFTRNRCAAVIGAILA